MDRIAKHVKRWLAFLASISTALKLNFFVWLARLTGKTCVIFNLHAAPLHFNFVKDLINRLHQDRKFFILIACDFKKDQAEMPGSTRVIATRFIPFIKADYVLTLDAGRAHIHRQSKLIHVPHSLASMHVIYPEGAFDNFDYIFCAGPHHLYELSTMLPQRGVRNCILVPAGYEVVDRLISADVSNTNTLPVILFAPSWGDGNALALKGVDIIAALIEEYEIILRPHVMSLIEDSQTLDIIRQRFGSHPRFSLDLSADSAPSIRRADLLISDWSGIAFEYALSFLKPVVFIDGPMKVFNPNWNRYLQEPGIEKSRRKSVGVIVSELTNLRPVINELLSSADVWTTRIMDARHELLFYPSECAAVSHRTLTLLAEHQTGTEWVRV